MKRGAEAVIPDIGPLKKLKVVDLRALCGDFNMPSTGTKDQLVQRLDAHRKATQSSVPSRSKVGSASIAERSGAATPESSVKRQRDELFEKYADECGTKIGLEGFMRLTLDLAGGDEDVAQQAETTILTLFLSWKMGAQSFGEISKEGFLKGLENLHCSSMEQILNSRDRFMAQLKVSFDRPPASYQATAVDHFLSFYNFCFELLKPEGKKYVEKDMGCAALLAIWKKVPGRESPHIDTFVEFLNSNEKILSINQDQWKSFVLFSRQVDASLTDYTEDDPWPSLFDDYVAWVREKRKAD